MSDRNNIYIVSGFNEAYLSRAMDYLETMHHNSNVNNIVITLDFDLSSDLKSKFENIKFVGISSNVVKSPNSNKCLQHGAFLEVLPFLSEESIIIFTDTDIKVQRSFNENELDFISKFEDGQIGVGYNESNRDFLIDEAERLKPTMSIDEISEKYPGIRNFVTFNTGVVITNKKTYKKLYETHNKYWPAFEDIFERAPKQQWLLSYLINKFFQPVIIPDIIHTHGKYPVELRVDKSFDFKFHIGSELVVLNHSIQHPAEIQLRRMSKRLRSKDRLVKKMLAVILLLILLCLFLAFRILNQV